MSSSPRRIHASSSHAALLRLVNRFELITAPLAGHAQFNRRTRLARRALRQLCKKGRVIRRELSDPTGGPPFEYFTAGPIKLSPQAVRERFAVLCFCVMSKQPKRLLSRAKLEAATASVRSVTGLALEYHPPCYPQFPKDAESVSFRMIRIARAAASGNIDLNQVVADLDRFVSQPAFHIWAHYARRGRFGIDLLVDGAHLALELETWLARRPPISRVSGRALIVPVKVHRAEPLWKS